MSLIELCYHHHICICNCTLLTTHHCNQLPSSVVHTHSQLALAVCVCTISLFGEHCRLVVVVPQSLWFLSLSFSVFVCTAAAVVACKANWQADGFSTLNLVSLCVLSLFFCSLLWPAVPIRVDRVCRCCMHHRRWLNFFSPIPFLFSV